MLLRRFSKIKVNLSYFQQLLVELGSVSATLLQILPPIEELREVRLQCDQMARLCTRFSHFLHRNLVIILIFLPK